MSRPYKLPKIGLALSSGGPRGLAHIGVLRALRRNKIPINYIAGTSAGALVGGVYAIKGDISLTEERFRQLTSKEFFRIFSDPNFGSGLLKGANFLGALAPFVGDTQFSELATPLRIVATDIFTGLPESFSAGLLSDAIRASASVPFLFEPHRIGDNYYIDGAISKPVPASVAREMGADIVIAANVETHLNRFISVGRNGGFTVSFGALSQQTVGLLQYNLAREDLKAADLVIEPELPDKVGWDAFLKSEAIIDAGDAAAQAKIPEIKQAILTWKNERRAWWERRLTDLALPS